MVKWKYWDKECRMLEAAPEVKHVVQDILYRKNLPFPLGIVMPFVQAFTICALPEHLRALHRLQVTWFHIMVYKQTHFAFQLVVVPNAACIHKTCSYHLSQEGMAEEF